MPCFLFQLPLPALPGTEACGSRTSPLPWGPQDWGPDEQRWRRGTVSGNPKLARVELLRRQRPRGESPQLNAPTSVRGQISNRLISCAAVRKNRKDKWITFTPNLPKRIRVNADKDLSSELGGRKCFAGPTNLWVFQYNTRNGSEWWLTGKIYDDACTETEGEGKTLCTRDFLHRQLDSLGTNQVTTMIPQSAHALTPRDMWSSL